MSRYIRIILAAIACIALQAPSIAQQPDELALTRRLADAGALEVALDRITRLQPRDASSVHWYEWEALRCTALAGLARHAELADRVAALPRDSGRDALAVCYASGARAALAVRRYAEARADAARALWQFSVPPAEVQAMRRVVIDSYVGERRGDEAYRAMLRYQQDHAPLPRDVVGRFVDALLDLKMEKEALNWLAALDDSQPAKLRLRLHAGLTPRDAAISQARAALAKGGDAGYWNVILDAAGDADALPLRVAAYEQMLNRADLSYSPADARRLWDAYLATAVSVANSARLLVGDDANWADYAGRRLGTEPAVSRAFFAHLAQHAQSAPARQNAQLQLLHACQTDRLELVALRVFDAMFGDVDALDTQVRYRLGAMAEARRQPAAAVRYWRELPAPPDADTGEWLVRVSRQRWLASGEDTGVDALARYYVQQKQVAQPAIQQGARYAEELLERGQYAAARRLLEALLPHVPSLQSGSLLFALGRARESGGEHALAGEAYLLSALAVTGVPDSATVQARLRAGVALARAGHVRDARAQLDWVINNAKDAASVETARSELKRLQL
ncbi:MAG TPA: hypothetical protein VNT02_08475 [Burkholderiales bacterium]|nr:hypothetical protein [Burkholderiales bacterium]